MHAAVASVFAGESCDIELIVVDDASDDAVEDVVDLSEHRITVVRTERAGPYRARNVGVASATGDYVRFLDADDISEPGSTTRLLDACLARPGSIAYGATVQCDDALRPVRDVTSRYVGDVTEACLLGAFHVYHVSMLFPREVVTRSGGWPTEGFRVSGDWDFVLRAVEQAPVYRVDATVTRYRRHHRSITRQTDIATGGEARQMVVDRYFDRHPDQRTTGLARRAYGQLYLDRAAAFAWAGDRRRALRALARGARRQPVAAVGLVARLAWARTRTGDDGARRRQ
jgi:glycosyltransferase involved in cell wall biosynthesis